jgi:hypothetical protein
MRKIFFQPPSVRVQHIFILCVWRLLELRFLTATVVSAVTERTAQLPSVSEILCSPIYLHFTMQAVVFACIYVRVHMCLYSCSCVRGFNMCLLHHIPVTLTDLQNLVPVPYCCFLLLGDLNGSHPFWRSMYGAYSGLIEQRLYSYVTSWW